jgi:AcrR family transcriptional regulator
MSRPRSRRGEGEQLRNELLDAAEALLNETGDERAVTIRAIVERVGVTPPSLYRHFASKEELVREAVARRFDALADAIDAGRAAGEEVDDPVLALRDGCLAYLRWGQQEPGGYALLFASRRETLVSDEGPSGTEAFDALVRGITDCQQAGLAREGDARYLALLVWSGLHGLATLTAARPHIDWPPDTVLVDELLAGLVGLPHAPEERA